MIDITPFGPVGEDRLRQLEQAFGVALPPDYQDFLARTGGGLGGAGRVPSPASATS